MLFFGILEYLGQTRKAQGVVSGAVTIVTQTGNVGRFAYSTPTRWLVQVIRPVPRW